MTQEEQSKRLVDSLERLSQAWRSMGQTADTLCESMEKLLKPLQKRRTVMDEYYEIILRHRMQTRREGRTV